jgi:ABC-2 type transport system permease protein
VLIEKELRTLSRSPRFRLVFFMGFSFGLIIWLPLAFGDSGNSDSTLASNYLTVVSVYAVMLLADALFWNCLGFDRSAVQLYFVAPVRIATVLIAKNAAAAIFVLLEILAVALVCALLRMPITPAKVFEACLVAMVLTSYLLGLGNLGSMHHPRAVDPAQTWRSNAAKGFQALLLLIYPFICAPVLLAYLARYAFASDLAFYLVLAAAAIVGLVIYTIALESACAKATRHRERIIAQLSASERPVS